MKQKKESCPVINGGAATRTTREEFQKFLDSPSRKEPRYYAKATAVTPITGGLKIEALLEETGEPFTVDIHYAGDESDEDIVIEFEQDVLLLGEAVQWLTHYLEHLHQDNARHTIDTEKRVKDLVTRIIKAHPCFS